MSVDREFRGVGGVIRRARLDLGLTLRDVASRIGMSHSYINDIEHGAKSPSEMSLMRLAKALNLNCDDLLLRVGAVNSKAKLYFTEHPDAMLILRTIVKLNMDDEELSKVLDKVNEVGNLRSVSVVGDFGSISAVVGNFSSVASNGSGSKKSSRKYPALYAVIKGRSR